MRDTSKTTLRRWFFYSGLLVLILLFWSLVACSQSQFEVIVHYPNSASFTGLQVRLLTIEQMKECLWKPGEKVYQPGSEEKITFSSMVCPEDANEEVKQFVCVVGQTSAGAEWQRVTPVTQRTCADRELHVFMVANDHLSKWRVSVFQQPSQSQLGQIPLAGHKTNALQNGRVLLTGGLRDSGLAGGIDPDKLQSGLWVFDVGAGRVETRWNLANPRAFHLQYKQENQVVLCGGIRKQKSPWAEVWEQNNKGDFSPRPDPSLPRQTQEDDWVLLGASVVPVQRANGSFLLISGGVLVSVQGGNEPEKWIINHSIFRVPTRNYIPCRPFSSLKDGSPRAPKEWQEVGKFTNARFGHTVTPLGKGQYLSLGGIQVSTPKVRTARTFARWLALLLNANMAEPALLEETKPDSWTVKPIYISGLDTLKRAFHTTVRIGKERFLVTGGVSDKRLNISKVSVILNFDEDKNVNLKDARIYGGGSGPAQFFHTAVSIPYVGVYFFGGILDEDDTPSGWVYLPMSSDWAMSWNPTDLPDPDEPPTPEIPDTSDAGQPDKEPPAPDEPVGPDVSPDQVPDTPRPDDIVPDVTPPNELQQLGFFLGANGLRSHTIIKLPAGTDGFVFTASFQPVAKIHKLASWFHGSQFLFNSVQYPTTLKEPLEVVGMVDKSGSLKWLWFLQPRVSGGTESKPLRITIDETNKLLYVAGVMWSNIPPDSKQTPFGHLIAAHPTMGRKSMSILSSLRGWHLFAFAMDFQGNVKKSPFTSQIKGLAGCKLIEQKCSSLDLRRIVADGAKGSLFLAGNFHGNWGITSLFPSRRSFTVRNLTLSPAPFLARMETKSGFEISAVWSMPRKQKDSNTDELEFESRLHDLTLHPTNGVLYLGGSFAGSGTTVNGTTIRLGSITDARYPMLAGFNYNASSRSFTSRSFSLLGRGVTGRGVFGTVRKIRFIPGENSMLNIIVKLEPGSKGLSYGATSITTIRPNVQFVLGRVEEVSAFKGFELHLRSYMLIQTGTTTKVTCTQAGTVSPCIQISGVFLTNKHLYVAGLAMTTVLLDINTRRTIPTNALRQKGFVVKYNNSLASGKDILATYSPTTVADINGNPKVPDNAIWVPTGMTTGYNNRFALLGTFANLKTRVQSNPQVFLTPMAPGNLSSSERSLVLQGPQLFLWTQGPEELKTP